MNNEVDIDREIYSILLNFSMELPDQGTSHRPTYYEQEEKAYAAAQAAIERKIELACLDARIASEHYWIKHYGEQRKHWDGSDGDMPQINELKRHQQLHKDRLVELELQREQLLGDVSNE